MAKAADKYFASDPWRIVEQGFDPAYARVSESIFSLGNEYMGVRGFFEEGYGGDTLIGSYFNGIYETRVKEKSGYKGIVNETQFMVNAVNWLDTEIVINDERLDLAGSQITDFERILDMRTGCLTRTFVWELTDGTKVRLHFARILSMENVSLGGQEITVSVLAGKAHVHIGLGLDGTVIHQSEKQNFWIEAGSSRTSSGDTDGHGGNGWLELETLTTKQRSFTEMQVRTEAFQILADGEEVSAENVQTDSAEIEQERGVRRIRTVYEADLSGGQSGRIERLVVHALCRDTADLQAYEEQKSGAKARLSEKNFASLLAGNTRWWQSVWESCDITIDGDEDNQQGIRFCIFQLFQTYHGAVRGSNIGAKGLTGEAYNGNAFWDTETYCLPFFLFNDMEGAKNLLYFRYKTLPEARKRAKELDCEGAFYPIATISGTECCDLWQHASLQLQASTAVSYGIWFYEKMTEDRKFLAEYGLEMLIEVARMLATRGDWSGDGKYYGFYGVMGPDEFQMMVNHDFYTNWMGRFALDYAARMTEKVQAEQPDAFAALAERIGYSQDEAIRWQAMAEHMYLSYDEETELFEQQMGFFQLPHIDVDAIPVENFPLYAHWSYDHIYRNDMIKQPDVLMVMLMFNNAFTDSQLRANYEYYEPRCIHESSLSPSVHSILASQLGKAQEAYDFFGFATRMDLDNYNRNTNEGIHTTSIAAAWMNIVYGFGGLRSDGEILSLNPSIPDQWNGYSFRVHVKDRVLCVEVDRKAVRLRVQGTDNSAQETVTVSLGGELLAVGTEEVVRPMTEDRL